VRATAVASLGTCAFLVAWIAWALLFGGPGFALAGIAICGVLGLIEVAEVSRVVKEAKNQCTQS